MWDAYRRRRLLPEVKNLRKVSHTCGSDRPSEGWDHVDLKQKHYTERHGGITESHRERYSPWISVLLCVPEKQDTIQEESQFEIDFTSQLP